MTDGDAILEVADRWWVLHESALGESLVRVYNQEITPGEALALLRELVDIVEVEEAP